MKEIETLRLYGKKLKVWKETEKLATGHEYERTTQVELAYKTVNLDGDVVAAGSEDFSPERMDSSLVYLDIWTWDGEKRDRGGHRYFDRQKRVRINRADKKKLRRVVAKWYPQAAEISIR